MTVVIRRHEPGKGTSDFLRAGHEVFRGDPSWLPPLDMMLEQRLDPAKDPFYRHADVALFSARKDGRLGGRISATIDRTSLDTWRDGTGHVGFFDTIDDVEVARGSAS